MLCLWVFCISTDPDFNVEKICVVFRVTSKWRKGVNISFHKSAFVILTS